VQIVLQYRSGTTGKDCFRDVADRLDLVAANRQALLGFNDVIVLVDLGDELGPAGTLDGMLIGIGNGSHIKRKKVCLLP
jgi:hypothetical protein